MPRYNSKHPWKKWFTRNSFTLREGRDFDCAVHGMAQQIRNAAGRYKKRVAIRIDGGAIQVKVVTS